MNWIGVTSIVLAASAALAVSAETLSRAQALAWLQTLDAGSFNQSWSSAGDLFKAQITSPNWTEQITAVRAPLGALITRTFQSAQSSNTLPGAPDGHYEMFQFATSFANKKQATETVFMAEQPNGWKVDGYFIK